VPDGDTRTGLPNRILSNVKQFRYKYKTAIFWCTPSPADIVPKEIVFLGGKTRNNLFSTRC
jgi:hypothetical protein